MRPIPFDMFAPIGEDEEVIRSIIDEGSWKENAEKLSRATDRILSCATRSIGGEFSGYDGASTYFHKANAKTVTLVGDVFWLAESFGKDIKIDISRHTDPLLYSFKFLDDLETKQQELYIAKLPDGWIYAL